MNRRIGVVGLGSIGFGMARNLIKAGYAITVYDVQPDIVDRAVQNGARACANPREIGEQSDVVICIVLNSKQVRRVVSGEDGLLAGMSPGSILVLSSTISPSDARQVDDDAKRKGITVLDAPVSGGKIGAEAGILSVMVGGPKHAFNDIKYILDIIGRYVVHINETVGSGLIVKATNQVIAHVTMVAIAEALVFGTKAGIDPAVLFATLSHCTANSVVWQDRVPWILRRDFAMRGSLDIQVKDLAICLDMGKEMQLPMYLSSAAQQVYLMAQAEGYGKEDLAAVVKVYEKYAQIEVEGGAAEIEQNRDFDATLPAHVGR